MWQAAQQYIEMKMDSDFFGWEIQPKYEMKKIISKNGNWYFKAD